MTFRKIRKMDGAVDRLAAVSNLMFDQRLIDLRKENEDLRHQLAMIRWDPDGLNQALAAANDTGLTEVCNCSACFYGKRYSQIDPEDLGEMGARFIKHADAECIVKRCLKYHLSRLGLTFMDLSRPCEKSDEDDDTPEDPNPSDYDCHVVIKNNLGFWDVGYGKKFCTTNFHRHPDLPVLEALFDLVLQCIDFFKVDGVDYAQLAEDAV